ncbi:beta strand repeat-containing protein [Streptomyces sp. NBC_01716]|uniref:beta strand repeat-containing protein n=1 Tax=Streptomyces sp. NBC_01716 TaxID=2975917 RepID=UPI002E36ACFE|nr:Ig-like domain repeat protein [Streptomyces sp. NBC_01716]
MASSITTLTSSPNPSVCGESVTFTVQVSPVPPETTTPTGTVNVIISDDGPTLIGTLDAAGQTQVTIDDLSVGTHQAIAAYTGDSTFDPSSSGLVNQVVNAADTTTVVTAGPNPSVCGETVTLCATVTIDPPGTGTPTGTVTFTGPGGLNQTVTLDATGEACITTTGLATGTITATYNGDDCAASSTGSVDVTVNQADTTTVVTAGPDPSVCGQPVTLCATVTVEPPGAGVPTGTVTFTGPGGFSQTAVLDPAGQSCITTTSLSTGTITATYNGDFCAAPSTGTVDVTVNEALTNIDVTVTPDPSVCGQSVTICATVTTQPPGSGTPTGTVTFTADGGLNQTVPLDAGGQACVTTTSLVTGEVSAVYSGGGPCFAGSAEAVAVTVDQAATTTSVTAIPDPSVCGELVTVCATVTIDPPGSGTPTGTVTFTGPGGLNQTVTLDAAGEACITTTALATGTITATYNGDSCALSSTGSTDVTVNPADTTTVVTAGPDPSVCGQSVTLCATVTTDAPGSGVPTGTVTFTAPGGFSQTAVLDPTGQACVTTTTLTTGTVTAVYNGAACFNPSTGTADVTVNEASTTTVVTATPNPSVCGQTVSLCATVTTDPPGSGTPTGTVTFTGPGGLNQTVTLNATGQACLTTTSLSTGTITATYNGEGPCFAGSSGTVAVTIGPADTTTTVTAVPDPSVCGELVTVCASVTIDPPGSGTPTGTVTFTGPGGLNQTVTLNATGQACLTTTSLETGTITATYNGSSCANPSTGTVDVTVNEASTTTVVTATPDPSVCGQTVTFCASVTIDPPGSGTPTGTVTFTGPGGLNQTVTLDAAGEACFTAPATLSGTVTATYSGDDCAAPSTGTVDVTVNEALTTTVVTATPDPSVCGQTVTVCATVTTNAPGSGTPTGTVTFTGPGGLNQTVSLDPSGKACLTTTTLASGTVTAVYNGEGPCFAASSDTVTVTVNPASTSTAVSLTPNPSVCGQSVTVCATVTTNAPGSGTPTGTVTFTGPGGLNQTVAVNAAGQACLTTTSLATGTITAHYNGAPCFTGSTGTATATVNPASTTTAVSLTPNPSVCGQSVTVCATVTTNAPGSGTPTGTVTFTGPGGLNQTVPLNASGQACFTTTSLATGTVTATYNGALCFTGSTGTATATVNEAATTTAVTATPNPSVCGQSVTVCATVTTNAPGSGTPTGTVTFTGPGGLNVTVPLNAAGQACLSSTSLASGTITATYNGEGPCFAASAGSVTLVVNPAATTTTVTATPNPSVCGQSVTLCATVTANAPGSGTPTGSVTFTAPGGLNVTVPLNAAGQACFSSTSLITGPVTAVYNGSSCFLPSTGAASLTVNPAASTTTVTATPNPSVCGQSVTVCATVTTNAPGSGTPTGTVTFTGPGGLNQTVPLNASGQACLTTTSLSTGTVTAHYNGTSCVSGSSGSAAVTVNEAATTTIVTATPGTSVCGQSVTVCAKVTTNAPGSGTPTGTVTFTGPGGLNQTVPLNASGQACLTTTSLSTGTITATYNGEGPCFAGSSGTVAVTVNPAATTTAVSRTPNPSVCGQSVTVCATVTTNAPGSGTPTGTVTFTGPGGLNQTVAVNAAGQACLTTTSLATGTITAHYNGAPCFTGSTGTATATVNPAATTTTVTATPNPSVCGQTVTVCATVTTNAPGSGTPTGTVTFTGPGGLNATVALNAAGQACFSSTSLSSGTITARYNGAPCFGTSTGSVVINATSVATTLTAAPRQVRLRLNGTFVIQTMNATLRNAATNAPIPGMTVTFTANAVSGPILIGTAVTDASGVATLAPPTVTVPSTIVTAASYTASFAAAGCFARSSVTASLTFVPIPPVP